MVREQITNLVKISLNPVLCMLQDANDRKAVVHLYEMAKAGDDPNLTELIGTWIQNLGQNDYNRFVAGGIIASGYQKKFVSGFVDGMTLKDREELKTATAEEKKILETILSLSFLRTEKTRKLLQEIL